MNPYIHRGKLRKITCIFKFTRNNSTKIVPINSLKNKVVKFVEVDKIYQKHLEEKAKFWIKKYEDLSGWTKVSAMQEKVLEVQKEVQFAQTQRRKVQEEYIAVQKKLQETQELLYKTSISDKMHLSYVSQVRELLMEEKRIQDLLSLCDQTEKEQQTNFALAIKNSHDNENNHREKTKFLSLISGVVCGIVGILFSSVINWRQRRNMRILSSQISDLQETVSNFPFIEKSKEDFPINENSEIGLEKLLIVIKDYQDSIQRVQTLLEDSSKLNKFQVDQLENNIDNKFKIHTSISLSMSSLLLFGAYIMYMNSR